METEAQDFTFPDIRATGISYGILWK